MRRPNKTWFVTWTLPVSIAHWLVATAAGCTKKGVFTNDACASNNACGAVTRGGSFPDDACASTKSCCAVSKKKFHRVLFRMTLAPPRNHVAQCPKTRSTLLFPCRNHKGHCPGETGSLLWLSFSLRSRPETGFVAIVLENWLY
jgi:hypothetical protein